MVLKEWYIIGTQEEAARAYDIAAIEYRGMNAVTNFDLSTYITRLKPQTQTQTQTQLPQQQSNNNIHHQFPIFHQPINNINNVLPTAARQASSSPSSALGLLFKSSLFKHLLQNNLLGDHSSQSDEDEDDHNYNNDEPKHEELPAAASYLQLEYYTPTFHY